VQICVNLDPKIHIVPSWLIDFAVRNLAFLILLAIRRAVVIVEEDPEYMKRMTDPTNEFYNFLRRRIHESLPTESQFVPSVRMRENSSEFEDAIDSSQDPDIQIC
jgi:hypothetical protein